MRRESERIRAPTYPATSETLVTSDPIRAPTYPATSETLVTSDQQTELDPMEIEEVEEVEHSEESSEHQQPEANLEQDYDLDVDDIPQDSEQYQQPEENLEQDYDLDVDDIPLEILDDKPDNPPDSDLNIPEQLSDASDLGSILIPIFFSKISC
jgi:DNA-directed RNA polymerase subunit beta